MQATPSSSNGEGGGTAAPGGAAAACGGAAGAPGGAAGAPGGAETAKKKGIPTWVGCLIGCGVVAGILVVLLVALGVLGAIAVPNFVKARTKAQTRGCFAIQSVIAGAVEMHDMDKTPGITELTGEVFDQLKADGYLREIPDDPGAGPGSAGNYVLVTVQGEDRPVVFCVRHGFRDRPGGCAEDASPAEQLRAAGIDDDDLLRRASENPPGVD